MQSPSITSGSVSTLFQTNEPSLRAAFNQICDADGYAPSGFYLRSLRSTRGTAALPRGFVVREWPIAAPTHAPRPPIAASRSAPPTHSDYGKGRTRGTEPADGNMLGNVGSNAHDPTHGRIFTEVKLFSRRHYLVLGAIAVLSLIGSVGVAVLWFRVVSLQNVISDLTAANKSTRGAYATGTATVPDNTTSAARADLTANLGAPAAAAAPVARQLLRHLVVKGDTLHGLRVKYCGSGAITVADFTAEFKRLNSNDQLILDKPVTIPFCGS